MNKCISTDNYAGHQRKLGLPTQPIKSPIFIRDGSLLLEIEHTSLRNRNLRRRWTGSYIHKDFLCFLWDFLFRSDISFFGGQGGSSGHHPLKICLEYSGQFLQFRFLLGITILAWEWPTAWWLRSWPAMTGQWLVNTEPASLFLIIFLINTRLYPTLSYPEEISSFYLQPLSYQVVFYRVQPSTFNLHKCRPSFPLILLFKSLML